MDNQKIHMAVLNTIKKFTGWDALVHYLKTTKWYRKLFDVSLLLVLLFGYGIAQGNLQIPAAFVHIPVHHVESSVVRASEIHKVIGSYQYLNHYNFLGHFVYHNTVETKVTSMPFMKYTLFEHATKMGHTIVASDFKDVLIQHEINMHSALISKQCYTKVLSPNDLMFVEYRSAGVEKIVACPYFAKDNPNRIVAFIVAGVDKTVDVDIDKLKAIADEVSILQ